MIQIFKSIFGRKTRFIALFIEIVIVTIIGWMIIEPVAINTTLATMPAGYDYDRLVMLTVSEFTSESSKYDKEAESNDRRDDYSNLLSMVRQREGVEKATYVSWGIFDSKSMSSNRLKADSSFTAKGIEDLGTHQICVEYVPNTDFFSTFGIKDVNGNSFQEPENDGKSYIISQSVAKVRFPGSSPIGKDLFEVSEWTPSSTIIGVTSDLVYRKGIGRRAICFEPVQQDENFNISDITIRLGEGVNPRTFIDKLTADLSTYRSGNYYLTHPVYMSDQRDEMFADKQRDLSQKWMIAAFFLVNVLLGVAGTFYVQCKTRIPDAGVKRAFGAPKWNIVGGIVGEAMLTTFFGWIIGSIIYLIYLKFQGFPMEIDSEPVIRFINPVWYDTKLGRYPVIGGIILLLLLLTSALGAWLPARKVGRVPIVDSLRDE